MARCVIKIIIVKYSVKFIENQEKIVYCRFLTQTTDKFKIQQIDNFHFLEVHAMADILTV